MPNLIRRREREAAPWEPLRMMRELMQWDPFREMERAFERAIPWEERVGFTPLFDVKETKTGYEIRADLPGVSEQDLSVTVKGNRLTISGRRDREERSEDESYCSIERYFGAFSRTFALPEGIHIDRMTAELNEGVLTVKVPVDGETMPKRVPVYTGK